MEAMLQRHCARYIYVIPDGLRELMTDISREVLRHQPTDMYTFIADYLDALMITRENARVAARLVVSLTEMATTAAEFLEETGMPREEVDNIVTVIQKTFKRSICAEDSAGLESEEVEEAMVVSDVLNEIRVSPERAEIAACVIQQAYRRFKQRKEREKELLAGMIDWRVAARSAIQLYRKTGVTNEEANRAATLIKAAYKGYYTRKLMKKIVALNQESFTQDFQFKPSEYAGEEEGEYLEELEGDDNLYNQEASRSDEKMKSVTIDYNTVKPHVAFDTSGSKLEITPSRGSDHVSTAGSIAKYSLNYIFDTALERIGLQSTILEETHEETEDAKLNVTQPVTDVSGEMVLEQDNIEVNLASNLEPEEEGLNATEIHEDLAIEAKADAESTEDERQ